MGKTHKDRKKHEYEDKDHWMQKAFSKNKGKLHRELGVKEGEKIPAKKLNKAAKSNDVTLAREANLAKLGRKYGGKK